MQTKPTDSSSQHHGTRCTCSINLTTTNSSITRTHSQRISLHLHPLLFLLLLLLLLSATPSSRRCRFPSSFLRLSRFLVRFRLFLRLASQPLRFFLLLFLL